MADLANALRHVRQEHNRAQQEVKHLAKAISIIEGLSSRNGISKNGRSGLRGRTVRPRRTISAAGRRRIAAAQRARWAKTKSQKPKRTLSQAARNRVAAAQRARWAKVKAQQRQQKKAA
jgi:hypothetical protein